MIKVKWNNLYFIDCVFALESSNAWILYVNYNLSQLSWIHYNIRLLQNKTAQQIHLINVLVLDWVLNESPFKYLGL